MITPLGFKRIFIPATKSLICRHVGEDVVAKKEIGLAEATLELLGGSHAEELDCCPYTFLLRNLGHVRCGLDA